MTTEIQIPENKFYDLDDLTEKIATIVRQFYSSTNIDELSPILQQVLGYDQVALYMAEQNHASSVLKSPLVADVTRPAQGYPAAGLPHLVAREKRLLCFNHLEEELPVHYRVNISDTQSELYLPLLKENRLIGVLSFGSIQTHQFSDTAKIGALQILAAQLSWLVDDLLRDEHKPPSVAIPRTSTDQSVSNHSLAVTEAETDNIFTKELQEVFNYIVNVVVQQLGYKGAMVAVVRERSQLLSLRAMAFDSFISQLGVLEKAEKMLGMKAIGASQSLIHDTDALGVKSCRTGKVQISHDLYDLFRPVVNRSICNVLQKTSNVRTCMSIPLQVQNKSVGNLFVGTKADTFTPEEQAILKLVATNTAIALRNALHLHKVQRRLAKEGDRIKQLQSKLADRMAEIKQLRDVEEMIFSLDFDHVDSVLRRILDGALKLTRAEYGYVVLRGIYAANLLQRVSYPDKVNKDWDRRSTVLQKVKIQWRDEVIGDLIIGNLETRKIDPDALFMLEHLAVQAGIAIRNAYQVKLAQEKERQTRSMEIIATIGDMAGNMVHSINNWIGSMRADIHDLQDDLEEGELQEEVLATYLSRMAENAEKTISLGERIRQPFRPEIITWVDVNRCIEQVILETEINAIQFSHLNIIPRLSPGLPHVKASEQLKMVFDNLLSNALRAMHYRGTITIETRLSPNRNWLEATIRDTGPGISPDIVNKNDIFKLGITSRGKNGTGFGLWWCDTYLNRLGGMIELVETSPQGCLFRVRLPLSTSKD